MSETDYAEGAVKQDPEGNFLAMRSAFDGERAWRVFRFDGAPHFVTHADIADWTDLAPVGEA